MKQLPLQSPSFAYAERGFGQWLDILGYAPTTVYNLPNAIRELFHWMETKGKTQLHQLTSVNIPDYYDYLRERENITRGGGLSNAYLNKHQQAIKLFADYLRQTGKLILPVMEWHFETTEEFIATIMLNDKQSYIINDNLDINANFRLDIEKLDVANFTNCSKWNNNEDVYLSFTRGKKDVSNYFKKFIGCTDYTSAKEVSENLKRALSDYFLKNNFDKKQAEEIKATIYNYCEQKLKGKEDISLTAISAFVNNENPEAFQEFASSEEYQISATFKGHNTLRSLKYYSFKSKDLSITFDGKLLDTKIFYNESKNQLLIKEVPDDLKSQLSKKTPTGEDNE